jgi:hypothetical protein
MTGQLGLTLAPPPLPAFGPNQDQARDRCTYDNAPCPHRRGTDCYLAEPATCDCMERVEAGRLRH